MAERFPDIELEETQELKENAANKNTKKKAQNDTLSTQTSLEEATTECSKSSPRSHLALRQNNFLASYYK